MSAISGEAAWWVLAGLHVALLLFVVLCVRRTVGRIERLQRELDAGAPIGW